MTCPKGELGTILATIDPKMSQILTMSDRYNQFFIYTDVDIWFNPCKLFTSCLKDGSSKKKVFHELA